MISARRIRIVAPSGAARQRGFALLIVLWSLVLLALLAAQVNAAGRSESRLARNLVDAANAQAAADGAVFEAASRLLDGSERRWAADGSAHALKRPNAAVTIRIVSENGKIDPNVAPLSLLQALIHVVGADARTAQDVATAIVEWRYPDSTGQGSARIEAAYRAAGRDYAPPDAAFQSLDELGLVRGMTPALLAELRPHLTVFHESDPDPRVADDIVAAAVHEAGLAAPAAADSNGLVATITADAVASGGSRFTRTATLQIGLDQSGAPYRIFAWR